MRQVLNMNFDWKFHDGDICDRSYDCIHATVTQNPQWLKAGNDGISRWGYNDTSWANVDLPHDFVCEKSKFSEAESPSQGCLEKGIAWYRKTFELEESDRDKSIHIEFDGIFRNFEVWFNGHLLGFELSGYKSVSYCIDDICKYDDVNVIAIKVDATEYEGWWYEGGGIYRNVRMVKTNPLYVVQWGTFVKSTVINSKDAKVEIEAKVHNENPNKKKFSIISRIVDQTGTVVNEYETLQEVDAYKDATVNHSLNLEGVTLWDIDNPYLYKLLTIIKDNDQEVDLYETIFGVRTIEFTADKGFFINGKNIKLKGVCCHEDHAGVGVALPDSLHEYRIKLLKEMGCNAYRTSHNPPTPALLEACDRLGMVVMDETRLMDTAPEYINQLKTLILRDRNHPSIILWSIGNEEMNIHGTDTGVKIMNRLQRITNELDPTRKATYGMNANWFEQTIYHEEHGLHIQVNGLNYNMLREFEKYDELHELYPDMLLTGSENASTLSTRGLYTPYEEYVKDLIINPEREDKCLWEVPERKPILSSYGDSYPPWGSTPMENWTAVDDRPFIAGVFNWTGFDYRGETNPFLYPCVLSHYGIMDLCGFPKDIYYYYKAWWTNEDVLHLFPHWDWQGHEGQEIDVCVFSNMDEVELFLNGESMGRKTIDKYTKPTWKVKYAPGVLSAKGYKDNKLVMSKERKTTQGTTKVQLASNKYEIMADNSDVAIVNIKLTDEHGNFTETSNAQLEFSLEGPGKIIGTGNGNPMSHENDKLPKRKAFHGLCQVIIQSTFDSGNIILSVKGEKIEESQLNITSICADNIMYVKKVTKDISTAKIIGERDAADGAV